MNDCFGRGSNVIPADSIEWDDVLSTMRAASIYHDRWYNQLSAGQVGGDAFLFDYQEGPYHAVFPLIFRSGTDESGREATSAYGYPGPLANTSDLPSDFIVSFQDRLQTLFASKGFRSACSRLNPFGAALSLIEDIGTVRHIGKTVTIDLNASNDERLRSYRRNHRKDISKIRKMCANTFEDREFKHIDSFIEIYRSNMNRVLANSRYFFDKKYFQFIVDHLSDQIILLMSEVDGEILGGGLFFFDDKVAYAHLVGFTPSSSCCSPVKLLFDDACCFFKDKGCKTLFLGGGVGANEDSLFHFKRGFSDHVLPFNVWEWSQ